MIQEAIREVAQLVKQGQDLGLTQVVNSSFDGKSASYEHKIDATQNGRVLGAPLVPFRPAALKVTTLTGFLDAVAAGCASDMSGRVVHVEDYLTVSVKSAYSDTYGVRDTVLTAKHMPIDAFQFDTYYADPAKFIIGLQVAFYQTDESLYLIRLASNLKAGNTVHTMDDGFSQSVTIKTGEVSAAEVPVKPRIKLLPIRTFPEPAPVMGEFLIRFKQAPDQAPSIALFNVDGTKWQAETMRSIKAYLAENLPQGTPILA
jgi:hypothetical protein